jgi:hypothetical protein
MQPLSLDLVVLVAVAYMSMWMTRFEYNGGGDAAALRGTSSRRY